MGVDLVGVDFVGVDFMGVDLVGGHQGGREGGCSTKNLEFLLLIFCIKT